MHGLLRHGAVVMMLSLIPLVHASEKVLLLVPIPDDAKIQVVSIDLVQNGHRLSIANLLSESSIDEVLDFYRNEWAGPVADDAPGFIENEAGDWSVISRPQNGWNQVVQLRKTADGIQGRISVLELTAASAEIPTIAMPANASLLSTTSGRDMNQNSTTYVVFSKSGTQSVADFYRHHFEDEGWSRVSDKTVESSQVMLVQRQGERAELVVSRMGSNGTLVVINKVVDRG